jgi:hypothetical protein
VRKESIKLLKELKNLDPKLVGDIDIIVNPNHDDVEQQRSLLKTYRDKLSHLLNQQAILGPMTPYNIAYEINECQENIRRIKSTLREWSIVVEDRLFDKPETKP